MHKPFKLDPGLDNMQQTITSCWQAGKELDTTFSRMKEPTPSFVWLAERDALASWASSWVVHLTSLISSTRWCKVSLATIQMKMPTSMAHRTAVQMATGWRRSSVNWRETWSLRAGGALSVKKTSLGVRDRGVCESVANPEFLYKYKSFGSRGAKIPVLFLKV